MRKSSPAFSTAKPGVPPCDIVALNAAAALLITGQAEDWPEAFELACSVIDEGRALKALEAMQEFCRSLEPV